MQAKEVQLLCFTDCLETKYFALKKYCLKYKQSCLVMCLNVSNNVFVQKWLREYFSVYPQRN